jgi:hypothetical protein
MARGALPLLLAIVVGCGSEQERTVSSPAPTPADSAVYDDCQSVIAVGSSGDAELTDETRKALKEAREALKNADALCGSDVDHIGEGWTGYAPLAVDSPEAAASLWVEAINARHWPGVCQLSVAFENCPAIVEKMFSEVADKVEIEGFHASEEKTTFAANLPNGLEPAIERRDGKYLVHFEYAYIE